MKLQGAVVVTLARGWAGHTLKFNIKVFFVMGKALTGLVIVYSC